MRHFFASTALWGLVALPGGFRTAEAQTNLFSGYSKKKDGIINDIPTTTLSNEREFPLVGMGVGNLQHNRIENMIYEGLKAENKIRLIDTARASQNEEQVARGIVTGVKRYRETQKIDERVQVHVVTKVWYTHLGYERTKISVDESMADLSDAAKDPGVDLRVHVLIHWPRCYDTISWMNCEEEESKLPNKVKAAGRPPHLNREKAWQESWRALEDMYNSADYPNIASIGVSNFSTEEMKKLLDIAREPPHITQINIWSLLFDHNLVELCNQSNIHIQLYNVMNGILGSAHAAPHAHHNLLMVANLVRGDAHDDSLQTVTAAQTVLKWLTQFGMSVIPRTSNLDRLSENSAVALERVPELSDERIRVVADATTAMMSGEDMAEDVYVRVTFTAVNEDMFLYFVHNEDDFQQLAFVKKGDSITQRSHPHHRFRMYHATNPDIYHDYTVLAKYGDEKMVRVEL